MKGKINKNIKRMKEDMKKVEMNDNIRKENRGRD